jgi:sulfonate transport system ATP-binding protein
MVQSTIFAFRAEPGARPPAVPAPIVRLRNFTRRFGTNTVLNGINLEIAEGEFVALLGRSGSGKTTLLRTLAGLDPVREGGAEIPASRAVVFQEPRLLPWKRVWENVLIGLDHKTLGGARAARDLALRALREVELQQRADAWPATLSGGEAQRAALARALVREPKLLLLDEPFASLDALTRIRMHSLVLALWQTHRPAVLLVTHDVDEAIALADRVLVLAEGKLIVERNISLPRKRNASSPEFAALRAFFLQSLGVADDAAVAQDAPPPGIMVGG